MIQEYIVKDSFYIKNNQNAQVLVLDHKRDLQKAGALEFDVDGRRVPFRLTHNEFWIIVEDNADYTNKRIIIN